MDYLIIVLAMLTAFTGVRGSTWDEGANGVRKITITGWVAISLACGTAGVAVNSIRLEKKQTLAEASQLEREDYLRSQSALLDLARALRKIEHHYLLSEITFGVAADKPDNASSMRALSGLSGKFAVLGSDLQRRLETQQEHLVTSERDEVLKKISDLERLSIDLRSVNWIEAHLKFILIDKSSAARDELCHRLDRTNKDIHHVCDRPIFRIIEFLF